MTIWTNYFLKENIVISSSIISIGNISCWVSTKSH